jgi:hypothetical protein
VIRYSWLCNLTKISVCSINGFGEIFLTQKDTGIGKTQKLGPYWDAKQTRPSMEMLNVPGCKHIRDLVAAFLCVGGLSLPLPLHG